MTARPVQTTSVRLSSATSEKLAELAQHTRRSEKELVDQAVDDYVERELAIISGIQLGLDDMRAGRVTPHADVMRELDEIIVQAEPPRTKALRPSSGPIRHETNSEKQFGTSLAKIRPLRNLFAIGSTARSRYLRTPGRSSRQGRGNLREDRPQDLAYSRLYVVRYGDHNSPCHSRPPGLAERRMAPMTRSSLAVRLFRMLRSRNC